MPTLSHMIPLEFKFCLCFAHSLWPFPYPVFNIEMSCESFPDIFIETKYLGLTFWIAFVSHLSETITWLFSFYN